MASQSCFETVPPQAFTSHHISHNNLHFTPYEAGNQNRQITQVQYTSHSTNNTSPHDRVLGDLEPGNSTVHNPGVSHVFSHSNWTPMNAEQNLGYSDVTTPGQPLFPSALVVNPSAISAVIDTLTNGQHAETPTSQPQIMSPWEMLTPNSDVSGVISAQISDTSTDSDYVCAVNGCNVRGVFKEELFNKHLLTHNLPITCACDISITFTRRWDYKRHLGDTHYQNSQRYFCNLPSCLRSRERFGKPFGRKDKRDEHEKRHGEIPSHSNADSVASSTAQTPTALFSSVTSSDSPLTVPVLDAPIGTVLASQTFNWEEIIMQLQLQIQTLHHQVGQKDAEIMRLSENLKRVQAVEAEGKRYLRILLSRPNTAY